MSAIFSYLAEALLRNTIDLNEHSEESDQKKQSELGTIANKDKISEEDRIHKIDQEACSQLDKAWKHFFGEEGFDKDLSLAKAFLDAAAGANISEEQEYLAPSVALARAFLNRDPNQIFDGNHSINSSH